MILILGLENVELLLNCILIKFTFLYEMHYIQGQSIISDIYRVCACVCVCVCVCACGCVCVLSHMWRA